MKFVADFHLHSKYSRATSQEMNLENLDKWGQIKGIKVLGTGDFTHPEWFKELKEKLKEEERGLLKLKDGHSETRFILTTEISCVYSKGGKVRKIHIILFAPSFEVVEKINAHLGWVGNLKADGRPTLGLDAKELTKIVLGISSNCLIVPAHIWTPWFSLFGSRSGFDSLEECFEEYSEHIFAGETGLSSDPAMNWRVSALDKITLISNSDSHSPSRIGREANVFDTALDYFSILEAIKKKDKEKLLYTIEFYPEEGKYHYDGHRLCNIRMSPEESKKTGGICPNCGKPLTIGVLNRVEQLADRPEHFVPQNAIPFKRLVPLEEIIAQALNVNKVAKQVRRDYQNLIKIFGSEFNILLSVSKEDLEKVAGPKIAEGVIRAREGRVIAEPGYDGVYGKIRVFGEEKENHPSFGQKTLF